MKHVHQKNGLCINMCIKNNVFIHWSLKHYWKEICDVLSIESVNSAKFIIQTAMKQNKLDHWVNNRQSCPTTIHFPLKKMFTKFLIMYLLS